MNEYSPESNGDAPLSETCEDSSAETSWNDMLITRHNEINTTKLWGFLKQSITDNLVADDERRMVAKDAIDSC